MRPGARLGPERDTVGVPPQPVPPARGPLTRPRIRIHEPQPPTRPRGCPCRRSVFPTSISTCRSA
ncbi:hypothetical protein UK82_03805 [Frankia sp. ACN1ag]|nr:hypothetical protein UK82_03805 [Frankia sp. ACN1ag]